MRVENQPYGRLSEIIYDQAFTVHPYKHQPIGSDGRSRGRLDRRRARLLPDLLRAVECDADDCRRLRSGAGERSSWTSTSAASRRPIACRAARHPGRAAAGTSGASPLEEPWPLPAVVVAYHITFDGHPDSYPLHMASKILSDGQSSRIYRQLVYDSGLALTAFGVGTSSSTRTCSTRSPSCSREDTCRRRGRPHRRVRSSNT